MRLEVGAATHRGRVRRDNEDAYATRVEQGLFVVCDGMGGAAAGEVASQLAVKTVLEQLRRGGHEPNDAAVAAHGYLPQTSRLADAVRRSNQRIYGEAQRDASRADMGTTIVSAWIEQGIASLAHVGDSRAYLWHDDRLELLTCDHSLVEAQVRAGWVAREDSLQSEAQNVLLRALGREPDVEVELHEVPVRPGDYLLLCSDGLTRMVSDEVLGRTVARLRSPQRIADYLIDVANRNGGVDNVTVLVVEVMGNWWRGLRNRWRPSGVHDAEAGPAV